MLSTPSNIERIRAISATLKDLDLAYRIFDELPDGILLVDRSGIIRLVNKQSEALFGYTRFELDGSPLSLLIPETLKGLHTEHFHAYLANPVKRPMMPTEKHGLKLVGVRKDGSEISLDISLTPIQSPEVSFVLAVIRS
jgi:PAS domain S-box-containing protein